MPRFTKKKSVALGLATVLVGVGAYAYWTSGGTGTGTAGTGEAAAIVVNQTSVVEAMGPGVAAQDLEGDFTNDTDSTVYVATVTAAITGVSGGDGACSAADYTLANAVSTVNAEVPIGDPVGSWGTTDTPTIAFNNSPTVNQDGCQNATVALEYTIT